MCLGARRTVLATRWLGAVADTVSPNQMSIPPAAHRGAQLSELPRGNSVMLSGLVGQALAICFTRVEGALAFCFLPLGAAFVLAGRSVPMCWGRGAGGLDGLDIPSSAP